MGGIQEVQDLGVLCQPGFRQCCKKVQDLTAPLEIAASQLAYYKGMTKHLVIVKKFLETGTPRFQVFDPD